MNLTGFKDWGWQPYCFADKAFLGAKLEVRIPLELQFRSFLSVISVVVHREENISRPEINSKKKKEIVSISVLRTQMTSTGGRLNL